MVATQPLAVVTSDPFLTVLDHEPAGVGVGVGATTGGGVAEGSALSPPDLAHP